MRTRLSLPVYALCLLIAISAGCSDDFQQPDNSLSWGEGVRMSYSIIDDYNTRQLSSPPCETVVGHAYLLFFSQDGEFVAYTKATKNDENTDYLYFSIPKTLEQYSHYSLVALANADEYTPSGYDDFPSYLDSFADSPLTLEDSRLLFQCKSPMTPQSITGLPMVAVLKGNEYFSFSNSGNILKITGTLDFNRLASRIDVTNNVKETFRLHGVGLCNWRNSYAPLAVKSDIEGNIKGVLTEENADCLFEGFPEGQDITEMAPAFYSFPYTSAEAKPGDQTTTALMLKATYANDGEASYYRLNIGKDGSQAELIANYRYNISVNSVKGSGKSTPLEAYQATTPSPVGGVLLIPKEEEGEDSHLVEFVQANATSPGKIVIDGFAPESFNSFIDIPFSIDMDESLGPDAKVEVSTDMEWPLVGAISSKVCKHVYYYCPQSFTDNSVYNASNKSITKDPPAIVPLEKNSTFYISVGAMAPDDPELKRTLTLTVNEHTVKYEIVIRPSEVIINDVIMNYTNNNKEKVHYLIADRNYQLYDSFNGVNENNSISFNWVGGLKKQAYNYCSMKSMKIPGKTKSASNSDLSSEAYHSEMMGFQSTTVDLGIFENSKLQWKKINTCNDDNCQSPFYKDDVIGKWGYMCGQAFKQLKDRIKVSKMRMFLMSDVPAKVSENVYIPICCYFPYYNQYDDRMGEDEGTGFYYVAGNDYAKISDTEPDKHFGIVLSGRLLTCDNTSIKFEYVEDTATKFVNRQGCARPAIELTNDIYDIYKKNYLGYGGAGTLKLKPCVPDIRE